MSLGPAGRTPARRAGDVRRLPGLWPARAAGGSARCRVLLVDDHAVVREGVAALISLEPDLEVCASVGSVKEAIERLELEPVGLVICDLNLPGVSGGQAIRALHERSPGTPIVALTAHVSLEFVRAAFISGARGYVCKDAPRSELLRAIRRAARGQHCVCGAVWEEVLSDWLENYQPPDPRQTASLDETASVVLRMVALGASNRRIAESLGRGVKATEKYRTALMRRLGLRNTASVTRFAIEYGLVSSLELDRLLEDRNP